MTNTELKTTAKQVRRLSTWELIQKNQAAQAAGDKTLAAAVLAEMKQRGK